MSDVNHNTCGNCHAEAWGFLRKELTDDGWKLQEVRSGRFDLCPDCARRFAESRRLDRLLKLEHAPS